MSWTSDSFKLCMNFEAQSVGSGPSVDLWAAWMTWDPAWVWGFWGVGFQEFWLRHAWIWGSRRLGSHKFKYLR